MNNPPRSLLFGFRHQPSLSCKSENVHRKMSFNTGHTISSLKVQHCGEPGFPFTLGSRKIYSWVKDSTGTLPPLLCHMTKGTKENELANPGKYRQTKLLLVCKSKVNCMQIYAVFPFRQQIPLYWAVLPIPYLPHKERELLQTAVEIPE